MKKISWQELNKKITKIRGIQQEIIFLENDCPDEIKQSNRYLRLRHRTVKKYLTKDYHVSF